MGISGKLGREEKRRWRGREGRQPTIFIPSFFSLPHPPRSSFILRPSFPSAPGSMHENETGRSPKEMTSFQENAIKKTSGREKKKKTTGLNKKRLVVSAQRGRWPHCTVQWSRLFLLPWPSELGFLFSAKPPPLCAPMRENQSLQIHILVQKKKKYDRISCQNKISQVIGVRDKYHKIFVSDSRQGIWLLLL